MSSYEKTYISNERERNKNNGSSFLVCEGFLSQVKPERVLNKKKKLIILEAIRREHKTIKVVCQRLSLFYQQPCALPPH